MSDRVPAFVMRDLSQKVMNDVMEASARTLGLVDHHSDRTQIAIAALRSSLAVAVSCVASGLDVCGTPVPRDTVLQVIIAKIEDMK